MSQASLPTAAAALEDDDLLTEILLRLPPQPSSLPRARAVSRRWRRLASDPRFCVRFRAHHRHNPPLLGCFVQELHRIHRHHALMEGRFQPALEAPNRVPEGRFTFPIAPIQIQTGQIARDRLADHFRILGCRPGLVLIFQGRQDLFRICDPKLLVWDPVTDDQHHLGVPPAFHTAVEYPFAFSGAALRAAGDHFQVVLVGSCPRQQSGAFASVYSSETVAWGNLVSTPIPSHDPDQWCSPAVMVGNSLYWLLKGRLAGIVEFDLASWTLALIPLPGEKATCDTLVTKFYVVPADGGGLGFLFLSRFSAHLWERKTSADGVASWVLGRTIALDKLLPISSEKDGERLSFVGLAENNNTVFVKNSVGIFTVHLKSLESKKIFGSGCVILRVCPFEAVYTAGFGGIQFASPHVLDSVFPVTIVQEITTAASSLLAWFEGSVPHGYHPSPIDHAICNRDFLSESM